MLEKLKKLYTNIDCVYIYYIYMYIYYIYKDYDAVYDINIV